MKHILSWLIFFISVNFLDVFAEESSIYALNIDTVIVNGSRINLLGETLSASEGIIGSADIANRPILRTGEILEFIPGMVVTQHSGSGKANQYFLRGFNLDHGTDFNTSIDGMPINMRTHGHGQGYTDLNFIIPEVISSINYKKGPYYADVGDFSGAGAAEFNLKNSLDKNTLALTNGENNFNRLLSVNEINLTQGRLLLAGEKQTYNGPWVDIKEDVNKTSIIARYISNIKDGEFSSTLMAYKNQWNSADQIPDRAVKTNLIDSLGSLDNSSGGSSSRYSLSGNWHNENWLLSAYAIRSTLDLYSNFTYFLDDPINGDQFEQVDERNIYGAKIKHQWEYELAGKTITLETGAEFRKDDIGNVGLYHTYYRKRLNTTRQDTVDENSTGLFQNISIPLSEQVTATLGGRYDYYRTTVNSNIFQNSGTAAQGNFSAKAGISYRITEYIEGYVNAGEGFHSNDARGTTITQDPITGEKTNAVNLLAPSTGAEVGIKLFNAKHSNLSVSFWHLRSASELIFVGDAGNTEASRSSERYGQEIAGYYWIDNNWSVDTELAWTHSYFTENEEAEGKYVEGSVPFVGSFGINYGSQSSGFHSAIHYRYFGARQLDSFNIQHANPTKTVNFGIGYAWKSLNVELDILNLFNSTDHDIDYYYTSKLKNEPEQGVDDLHYHPVEPRTFRFKSELRF